MNSFMISVSLGLQYGVPLEVYVSKFSHMRFEPSGLTNDEDIRVARQLVRIAASPNCLEMRLDPTKGTLEPGAAEAATPSQSALFNQWDDTQKCARCGGPTVPTGSCYTCGDCGTNSGCRYGSRVAADSLIVCGMCGLPSRPPIAGLVNMKRH
jgi:ribonucleoside-diphosphate reductase alpha chain